LKVNEDVLKLLKEKEYFKQEYNENSWDDICKRVSKAIASPEETTEMKEKVESEVFNAMSNLEFIFSTPVLLNADVNSPGQLSSCFINSTRDTIEDICKLDAQFTKIFQKNGGAGTDLSVLRPAKSSVNASKGYAGGVLSFMEKYDATADIMTRNNPSRKGALKINLQCWHPQIIEFCHCKEDLNKLNRMNISVSLTDKFMQAVINDEDWNLVFPDYENCKDIYDLEWDGDIDNWIEKGYPIKIYQTIKAKELLKLICECSYKTGDPGFNYQTTMNNANPNKHLGKQVFTNPCSEFVNIPGASCNLASFNLTKFVKTNNENTFFDFNALEDLAYKCVRWFDNMITINKLPLDIIDDVTKKIRPIGAGFFGLADAMYMLKIRYGSPEALKFAESITKTIRETLEKASVDLAKERGVYPAWEGSEWCKKNIRIRNSSLVSIAPTGSISFIAGVSGGLEPNYGLCYNRRTYDGNIYYIVNSIFKAELEKLGIYSEDLMEKISKNRGSCQGIKEIPKDLQDIFVVASDLTPKEHVDMVAAIQKYTDLSTSKTINFANKATVEDIYDIIIYAWKQGLKGLTVYR
jgi:ribonucleoside-diphosphate reductase alpha chain